MLPVFPCLLEDPRKKTKISSYLVQSNTGYSELFALLAAFLSYLEEAEEIIHRMDRQPFALW